MKNYFLLLCCMLAFLTSCNKEFENTPEVSKQHVKIRWYGAKVLESQPITRGVADNMKLWASNPVITVKFLNQTNDPALMEKIKTYAKEWEEYAGIEFKFVEQTDKTLVRIGFDWEDNSWLTWSYTGTDAKMVRNQNEPTACFGGLDDGWMSDEEIRGDVLRVFGQILGLEYEQRHMGWDDNWWKKDKNDNYYAQKYWENIFDGYYEEFDWETIKEFVFDPLSGIGIHQTEDLDLESIMIWPNYTKKETTKPLANYELSEGDKEFIARLYPKKGDTLPTIQKAWVDAGYFEWTNANKNALKITSLGLEQEYLPDVSDGEQIISANMMFFAAKNLKEVPRFNTVNITDFKHMFSECRSLTSIPLINTAKGTDFRFMFANCSSLISIPLINTTNGIHLGSMFINCTSLMSIPLINTAKGNNFQYMFANCTSLTSIPLINTTNGIYFNCMFEGCFSLTSIPLINTTNGDFFAYMFNECSSLTSIPLINTTNGTKFQYMFNGCTSLTSIPLIDTAKGTNFEYMFYNCSSLISKPDLNLSNAEYTYRMYEGTPFG
jgi:hypothetical protein